MKVFIRLYTIRGNINGDTSYLIEKRVQRLQLHQLPVVLKVAEDPQFAHAGELDIGLDAYRNWIKTALIWSCMHSTELTKENWCLGKMPDWNLSVSPRYTTLEILITGDFNARQTMWNHIKNKTHGELLINVLKDSEDNLTVLNSGLATFRSINGSSVIDLFNASQKIKQQIVFELIMRK